MIGEGDHLFFYEGRLFVNPTIGCHATCKYCYLGDLGLTKGSAAREGSASDIIDELQRTAGRLWRPGKTIVSLGCYSEPWSRIARIATIDILKYLDVVGSRTTISTKQYVSLEHLDDLGVLGKMENLFFLISMPVLNQIREHERGTSSVRLRIQSVHNLMQRGYRVAIYVKPVIAGVTIQGLSVLKELVREYRIPVVLGREFTSDGGGDAAPISASQRFREAETEDFYFIKSALEHLGPIVEHSRDVFNLSANER